jgi:hypothetical protein
MTIYPLYLFIFTYVFGFWIAFPTFTKRGTGYLKSVFASHVVMSPILLLIFYGVLISV